MEKIFYFLATQENRQKLSGNFQRIKMLECKYQVEHIYAFTGRGWRLVDNENHSDIGLSKRNSYKLERHVFGIHWALRYSQQSKTNQQ